MKRIGLDQIVIDNDGLVECPIHWMRHHHSLPCLGCMAGTSRLKILQRRNIEPIICIKNNGVGGLPGD